MRRRKLISSRADVESVNFKMVCVCWLAAVTVIVSLLLSRAADGQHAPRTSRQQLRQIDHNHLQQKLHHHHHHHSHYNHHHHHHHQQHERQLWLDPREPLRQDHHSNQSKFKARASKSQQGHHQPHRRQKDGQSVAPVRGYPFGLTKLSKRQALNEAIHELRILESQDSQLRAFTESARSPTAHHRETAGQEGAGRVAHAPIGPHPWRDFHCHLKLMTNERPDEQQQHRQQQQLQQHQQHKGEEEQSDHGRRWDNDENNFCLRNGRLASQIPPFMLNLYRQLSFDLQRAPYLNFSETVQMMPYKAEIMRSFRQPKLASGDYDDEGPASEKEERGGDREAGAIWLSDAAKDEQQASEREDKKYDRPSRLATTLEGGRRQQLESADDVPDWLLIDETEKIGNVVVELSVLNGSGDKGQQERAPDGELLATAALVEHASDGGDAVLAASEPGRPQLQLQSPSSSSSSSSPPPPPPPPPPSPACDLRQRLLPAHQRDEICFWFKLDKELPKLIGQTEASSARERLVEAELHVFKLFPQALRADANQRNNLESPSLRQANDRPGRYAKMNHNTRFPAGGGSFEQQFVPGNRTTTAGNLYHFRTNLLEVSLYQILPKRLASNANGGQSEKDEFPLRLLDIRRIDLNSNGWETFYVKRAVEDWLREPRLNLGLVIKAKSMFDEPIRVGLIRFADAYDQADQKGPPESNTNARQTAAFESFARRAKINFNLSHQPMLVVYTTRSR